MDTTPAMGRVLNWKESRSAVYPQCSHTAVHGAVEYRIAHFEPGDAWRLTARNITTNESPYDGWLHDDWFPTLAAAQEAAEALQRNGIPRLIVR